MLCIQHSNGGYITNDDMEFILPNKDPKIYSKFVKDEKGYYNVRLKEEIDKRKMYSESRRKNRLGTQTENNQEDINIICQSYDKHMENENIIENINIDINVYLKLLETKTLKEVLKKMDKDFNDILKNIKHKYGEYNHVLLTDEQYKNLITDFPKDYELMIKNLDEYIEMKGAKYKNHYLTMKKWKTKDKPVEEETWKPSDDYAR